MALDWYIQVRFCQDQELARAKYTLDSILFEGLALLAPTIAWPMTITSSVRSGGCPEH
jgi:hypothetical protein